MKKLKKAIFQLFILTTFFFLCSNVFSAEQGGIVELEEMVVRGVENRLSADLAEIGHPVVVVSGEELREAGFVDLQAALEAVVPGYWAVARAGRGGYQSGSLQGSEEVLWLLDGVRLNNRLYASGYPNTLSLNIVDRVEIMKAGESLFYGSDATAGAINIITKDITDETSGNFGTSYGQKNFKEAYGHVTGTFNGHGMMVFGSREGWDGYVTSDNEAYQNALNFDKQHPTGYDRNTVGLKYSKEFDPKGKTRLKIHAQKQQGYFDYGYPHFKSTTISDWEEEIVNIHWEHDVNDHFSYFIKPYMHTWWSYATFVRLDGSFMSDAAPWGYDEYGTNIKTSTRWGDGHEMLAGLDFQRYKGKDEFPGANFFGETENVYGLFASYRPYLPFSPKTRLALGTRYTKTSGTDSTIWDISFRTPIANFWYIRGVINTSFELPNIQQLYTNSPISNRFGNPNLNPEEGLNTEVGIGGNWDIFYFEAAYFNRKIEDLIGVVSFPDGSSTYENTEGETEIDGVTLSAGIGPFSGWSLDSSATWSNAEDALTGLQLPRNPKFYAKTRLNYRYPSGRFGGNLTARYTGDIYERNLTGFDDVNYGSYFVFDLSAFLTFGKDKRHRITFRLENIFDEEYDTRWYRRANADGDAYLYSYNGTPRNAILGYSYSF
jgi:outer membrane cobalamin receptor